MKKKHILFLLIFFVGTSIWNICSGKEVPKPEQLQIISALTGELFNKQHYRQHPIDPEISRDFYHEFFRLIDPNRLFFTAEDMKKFEPMQLSLGSKLQQGDVSFAFQVYNRFMERFEEYVRFVEEELKKECDFTTDEVFQPDRSKLPWAENDEALHQLWRTKLKSDQLYFRLNLRAMKNAGPEQDAGAEEKRKIRELWSRKSPQEKILQRLRDLRNIYRQRDELEIVGIYLNALALAYGPHSGYQTPKVDKDFEINMSLTLIGIGATLTSDDGYIRVVSVVPGGPAARDGRLQPEDRIIAVTQDGSEPVDVIDMSVDNAVKLIRGEAGTKVTLTVLPGKKGRNAVPENITLTREKVLLKESEAQGRVEEITVDGKTVKTGIISLPGFYLDFSGMYQGGDNYKSCSRDVKKILEDFNRQGVETLVMDLRGNGGGSLLEAVNLSGLFIQSGPVVQIQQANRSVSVESDRDNSVIWQKPMVVLTNKMSASASEIFAAAMQDYRRAVIVGDSRTFGKGTVLNIIQLEKMLGFINRKFPAGSVRLETALFFRVNGGTVQQLGVESDIVLPSMTEPLEIGEMFSNHHLPWTSIDPLSYRYCDPELPAKIQALKKRSETRITADQEYSQLISRMKRLQQHIAEKTISLNEEKRWKEYQEDRDAFEDDGEDPPGKPAAGNDPVVREAARIAADLTVL